MTSTTPCFICGSNESEVVFQNINGTNLRKCHHCKLISQSPLPSPKQLSEIYSDDSHFNMSYFKIDDEQFKTNHFDHFKDALKIIKNSKTTAKVLEIGPGNCTFLALCQDNNINIDIVDFSPIICRKIQDDFNTYAYNGDITDAPIAPNSYDFVVAFDVIEHCTTPKAWIEKIFNILKPGGTLILSTISIENCLDSIGVFLYRLKIKHFLQKLYPKYHIHYFTPKNLKLLIESSGLTYERLTLENYDVRKASANSILRLALRCIYGVHNLTGNKTNQYIIARKTQGTATI